MTGIEPTCAFFLSFFLLFPRVAHSLETAPCFLFPPSSLCLPLSPHLSLAGKFYFVADAVRAETGHACATSSVRAQRSAGAAPQEWALRIWDWQNLDCIQRHKGAGDEEEGGESFSCCSKELFLQIASVLLSGMHRFVYFVLY